jgi:hypothetical protein
MLLSDALGKLSSAIQQLSVDYLIEQIRLMTSVAMLHVRAPMDTADFRLYNGALLQVLVAECERRGLTFDPAVRQGQEMASALNKPTEPKVQ